jgi:hypothetical protein
VRISLFFIFCGLKWEVDFAAKLEATEHVFNARCIVARFENSVNRRLSSGLSVMPL